MMRMGDQNPELRGGGPLAVAWVAAVAITALAVGAGLAAANTSVDIDEALYRRVVTDMRAGAGYYDAVQFGADQSFSGEVPRQLGHVWAVRPPTAYLVWRLADPDAWRWLVALPIGASLVALVMLSRRGPRWSASVAVGLASLWVLRFTPHLYLHTELWSMPLLLWGAALLRRRPAMAAAVLLSAALTREILVVGLLVGLVVVLADGRDRDPRRAAMPWLAAIAVWAVALVVHSSLAVDALTPGVADPPFWNPALGADYRLGAFFPGQSWLPSAPLVVFLVGLAGAWMARGRDPAARFVVTLCPLLTAATLVVARPYWQPMWALLPLPWVSTAVMSAYQSTVIWSRPGSGSG